MCVCVCVCVCVWGGGGGGGGEVAPLSMDVKMTQTTNPILIYEQDNNVILDHSGSPIALLFSNNQPEMYCRRMEQANYDTINGNQWQYNIIVRKLGLP